MPTPWTALKARFFSLREVSISLSVGLRILISCSAILLLAILIWFASNTDIEHSGKYYDDSRDYKQLPFGLMDATKVCEQKTRLRYGSSMQRSYVDGHSTRFDDEQGLFLIFMNTAVGTIHESREIAVHCFVDPKAYMISHYRAIDPARRTMVSQAVKFFSSGKKAEEKP
ncbi:MAG: hypothetical protein COA42_04595 [Alteromonadaceae bacterium]|nr:MAG: hypothetical protein COA42_04595 [Alteromonadaceae bacterium]